jgi:glycosyltransferase involved in cell wall biosynthesis
VSPRVTVILSTYNRANVLPFSIGSVLGQAFTDFELLVIGDACTDESEDVVRAITDPRVAWINLPQRTGYQSGPNSEGLRRARGAIVAYLGHDDLWLPNHLEVLTTALDAGAAWGYAMTLYVDPVRAPYAMPARSWSYRPGRGISPTTLAHRRDAVAAAGGWRMPDETGSTNPDTDLWTRMTRAHGSPLLVRRLTSVRFPAVLRPDVYRTRPSEEQARWSERISSLEDPEAAFLAEAGPAPRRRSFLALRSLVYRIIHRTPRKTAAQRIREYQRFKGVPE